MIGGGDIIEEGEWNITGGGAIGRGHVIGGGVIIEGEEAKIKKVVEEYFFLHH